MKKIIVIVFILVSNVVFAQSEIENIRVPLLNHVEGTANGDVSRLKKAFHPSFNLYYVANDSLKTWVGNEYIAGFKEGVKSNRIGRIVSIDYENNAAIAKIEVDMPARKRLYTDYLILLKYLGEWKIIHKSFTFIEYK
jgi:Putative lumazine-binding